MTKRKTDLSEYCTAREAAQILSLKYGRIIQPGYIHRIKQVRCIRINKTSLLYHRGDIQEATIRQRSRTDASDQP